MTEIITFAEHRSPAASSAWSTFLNCRLAYIEHRSETTRAAVQSAYLAYALAFGLSVERAHEYSARLDAVNGWEQSVGVLVGSLA